jgi:hypothetical protein
MQAVFILLSSSFLGKLMEKELVFVFKVSRNEVAAEQMYFR